MPRKSAASLTVATPDASRRITPRDGCPRGVAEVFREISASVPSSHFVPSDSALLEQYAQAIVLCRDAYAAIQAEGPVVDGKPNPWCSVLANAHKSSATLATRLRLAPQSRADPKTVGRAATRDAARGGPRPWDDDTESR